jgi:hypothetical protein
MDWFAAIAQGLGAFALGASLGMVLARWVDKKRREKESA